MTEIKQEQVTKSFDIRVSLYPIYANLKKYKLQNCRFKPL